MIAPATRTALLAAVLVAMTGTARAEVVYWSPTRTDADVSVFVTDIVSGTGCLVYVTQSRTEAQHQPAVWFVTPDRTEATLVVFRSATRRDAERVVAFVRSRGEAKCPAR